MKERFLFYSLVIGLIIVLFISKDTYSDNLLRLEGWLLGINFTIAFFSINFTFFGVQFSNYKSLVNGISKRQWFTIVVILFFPVFVLISKIFDFSFQQIIPVCALPLLLASGLDNAWLTWRQINPKKFISEYFTEKKFLKYLDTLFDEMNQEVKLHEGFIKEAEFQMPVHEFSFKPKRMASEQNDPWNLVQMILSESLINRDHKVFGEVVEKALLLLRLSCEYKKENVDGWKEESGIRTIASTRFHAINVWLYNEENGGVFFDTFSSKILKIFNSEMCHDAPTGSLSSVLSNELLWIAERKLESSLESMPLRIVTSFHHIIEESIRKTAESNDDQAKMDYHNITSYVRMILQLVQKAITERKTHFIYRGMETISYLGCNAAKLKSQPTVLVCMESLVQIGRESRACGLTCFYSRCIIPFHLHAEEFIDHILTWIVGHEEPGDMLGGAEIAKSRLRGYRCAIKPVQGKAPISWVRPVKTDDGKKIPHKESFSGMYGYYAEIDYSDLQNVSEYVLRGVANIRQGAPVPIVINSEETE